MSDILLIALILLAGMAVVLQLWVLKASRASLDLQAFEKGQERSERLVREELGRSRQEANLSTRLLREELDAALKGVGDTLHRQLTGLVQANDQRLELLRGTLETRLRAIQEDNARQLEQMRATVDEKLQGTLEKRLGESFRLVGERLEQVYRGLGEMQTLATGVGDLKKVLTNVKTRGTWGEVQLGTLLEQVLTPDQFAANVATKGGRERVEFAIRLPGRDEGEPVWLPIDAKFPVEDYQRLLEAPDGEAAEAATRALELRIRQCAREIAEKYLDPPRTTDFALLFLPTEGLFAEVVRRPGLTEQLQREHRVVVAGPTTLWSILNSLQMGFRTLAIQQRSSEVWHLLGAVKTEWSKYGEVLERIQKQLHAATDTLEKAQVRNRAIGRKLRGVQDLPADEAHAVLALAEDGTEEG